MTKYREPQFPAIFVGNQVDLRESDKRLITTLGGQSQNLKAILDGGISLADNMDIDFIEFTSSATPDAENTISHALGKAPTGFVIYDLDKGAVVYRGSTTWTNTQIYLKVNTASVAVKAWVF